MSRNIQLLIIDPQNDFCDPNGALSVKGADQDMDRLALMIHRLRNKLDDIHVTLDSHRRFDVAHPIYWVDSNGNNPKPFTIISVEDVEKGVWVPSIPGTEIRNRSLEYVRQLKANGRYALCVWPEHCLISSDGACVNKKVFEALQDWQGRPGAMVDFVTKGSNPWTEHYSAVQAEVIDPADPTTQLNTSLIKTIMTADDILVAGEASSHCLANTVRDIANNFGDDSYIKRLVYLKDASSPVSGFESFETDFLKEMTARGMRISTTVDYLA